MGDLGDAMDDALMESGEAQQNQMMKYLNSKEIQAGFRKLVFEMVLAPRASGATEL